MEWLALSILVSTVLFLVDRNQAWPKFWRVSKWVAVAVLIFAIGISGYYWLQHSAPKRETFYNVEPIKPAN